MSTAQSRKIVLVGTPLHDEAVAGGAIKPGHLIKLNNLAKAVVHNDEGGYAERAFAVEDALQGGTIDDAYATTGTRTRVSYALCRPGDEVAAFIKKGSNVAIGDQLISAGDGTLIPKANASTTTQVEDIVGIAREAIDLSDTSGDVDTRIRVRVR